MTIETITAVVSDPHIGGSTALAPHTYQIHTGRKNEVATVNATKDQNWLWSSWLDYWRYVYSLTLGPDGKKNKRLVVLSLGDLIDGNHHDSTQIMQEVQDQIDLAVEIFQPVRDMADLFAGVVGTSVHTGIDHSHEYQIYKRIGSDLVDYQLNLDIDGQLFDIAHHTTGKASNKIVQILKDYTGERAPDFIIRGHKHEIDDTGYSVRGSRMVVAPCWQKKTSFGWKVHTGRRADIGALVVHRGDVDFSRARYIQPNERPIYHAFQGDGFDNNNYR